jgi:phosphonate transport system substrate-binding protein
LRTLAIAFLFAVMVLDLFAGCVSERDPPPADSAPSDRGGLDRRVLIRFGVGLKANPRLTHSGYQPLMDFLTRNTPYRVELRLGRDTERTELDVDFTDLETYLEERIVEIAPLGVLSYFLVERKFGALPIVKPLNKDGEPVARSVFLCRQGSPMTDLRDLRGHRLAFGPAHSTLSHVIPRFELVKSQVPLEDLSSVRNLPDEESVIESVLEGRFDAGAVSERLAGRLNAKELRILHVSDPISTRPLVVRGDFPEAVTDFLRKALLELNAGGASDRAGWDEEFRYGFAAADASDYEPVRSILNAGGRGCAKGCHEDVRF